MNRTDRNTITVTFVANFELDVDEFDLRYKKPEKVEKQIHEALVLNSGRPQELLATTDAERLRIRREVKKARATSEDKTREEEP